jgi:tetratricopeptide (TPR) repeat protein
MSRKRKHYKASATLPVANGAALPGDADAALGASRYREAIEHYKELLKRERRPAWLAGLAAAYAGRAAQLAAKGLVKEALALWRTRADMCGTPLLEGPYVGWVVQAGEAGQALRLLAGAGKLPPEAQAQLETQLAGVVLVAPDSALTGLPPDSPLLRHRAAAQAALAACARGDDAVMAEHLQAIPFRSPYRDLRAILKALALCTTDIEQAAGALARVPAHGPFEASAAPLRACVLPGQEWVAALRSLDEEGRALVLDVKGCPEERRALLLELAELSDGQADAAVLFDLLVRHRRTLPEGAAAQLCRRLLPHAPQLLRAYAARFGSLPAAEQERIVALAAELKRRPEQAEDHWLRVVQCLGADPAERRRAALVLRHLADHLHHCGRDGNPCEDVLGWWAQSLELDPEDRATHLNLIRALRSRSDLKQTRARLDAALARFPKDTEVLLEAVETALASGAFKKAAGLAKRVLELDPINPRVRAGVGHAHLSHARKQIAGSNPAAARGELEEAAQWLRSTEDRGSIKLLRGFIDERAEESDALLREGLAELGGTLVGSFHLLLEAWRTKRDPKALLRRAGVDLTAAPRAEEIVALAHALNTARDGEKALRAALGPLRAMVGRAAAAQFAEPDQLLVCEALHRCSEHDLARRYAEAALRRWPRRPVFVYLKAAAIYGANPWRIPQRELVVLEQALAEAQSHGDQRTALRLHELLSAATGEFGLPGEDLGDDDLEELPGDAPRAMLEMMLALGGEDRFLDIARQQLGKDVFDELRRELGGNKKQFARALTDVLARVGLPPGPGGPGANADAQPASAASPRGNRGPPHAGQKDLFDD